MDIQLLRTFISVCELQHFGRAAEQLCVTQSSVSARIRLLEDTLGVQLLERSRKAVVPTAAGQRLLPHARSIVETWQRARLETGLAPEQHLAIGIGAPAEIWPTLFARGLAEWAGARDAVAWRLEMDSQELLLRRLRDGLLDLIFSFSAASEAGWACRELTPMRLLACRSSRDAANPVHVERAELAQSALLDDVGVAPRLRCNNSLLAQAWLARVGGRALLDEQVAAEALASGVLSADAEAPRQRPLFALYRSDTAPQVESLWAVLSGE